MMLNRCIAPTAAPVGLTTLICGFFGLVFPGRRMETFKAEIREYFATNNVYTVSSGKAALTLILSALASRDSRREVIIPAYTCYSVPASIVRAGLTIKVCDIDPLTLDYNYDMLEKIITNETLCVITSNLFGVPANINRLKKLKEETNVTIIEDVAQAMGAVYDNRRLGTYGDAAFFSLGRGKNVTCGSGGVIITNSESLAAALNISYQNLPTPSLMSDIRELLETVFMSVFIRPWLYRIPASLPFLNIGKTFYYTDFDILKLSSMKAWLMKGWVSRLHQSNRIRCKNSSDISGVETGIAYLRLPYLCKSNTEANCVNDESVKNGLGIVGMYPTAICDIPELSDTLRKESCEAARSIAGRLLTVPTHQLLSGPDKRRLTSCIDKYSMKRIGS